MASDTVNESSSTGDQNHADPSTSQPQPPPVLEVIRLLEAASILCCIVGTRALRYFGAGRVADEWDICIKDDQLEAASQLIKNSGQYIPKDPPYPNPKSLRHKYPTFKPKESTGNNDFAFLLEPSSDAFVDPRPEFCERSHSGIPYPQDIPFAKSLLAKRNRSDIADFIDAQDLTPEWGEKNIDFDKLQSEGVKFATRMNEKFAEYAMLGRLHVERDLKKDWMSLSSAESKEGRIEPLKQGRYFTRWRLKSRPGDPRLNEKRKGI